MNRHIDTIRKTRIFILQFVDQLSIDELNTIPAGFSNNIIWNMGHMVAAQQGVCYKRAGVDMAVEEQFFEMYKPGSKPEQTIGLAETERIRQLMMTTLDGLQADYEAGIFSGYTAWVSRYGVNIDNIDDALAFLPFHEGLHSGYIMAMKRVIKG